MLLTVTPKKFSFYVSNGKMTCAQVKATTGADIVINGSLYSFKTFIPNCDVKINGKVYSDDQYKYWGYGWNATSTRMYMTNDINTYQNYISCVGMLKNSTKLSLIYNSDLGGKRGRTAIGFNKAGKMVIYCSKDGTSDACTIETLQTKMLNAGCVDALCLDGGGSSQMASIYGNITSTRKVANWICIWVDKSTTTVAKTKCPYVEPTITIKLNSRGTGAKWVQWMLNATMNSGLVVDGIFGSASKRALVAFQKKYGLTADGLCGAATRAKLKAIYNA